MENKNYNCEDCKCNNCTFIAIHSYDECHKCGICGDNTERNCDK